MQHIFENKQTAILVVINPAVSRGLDNPIMKEDVIVSHVEKNEVRIKNRNTSLFTYAITTLFGVKVGKRIETEMPTAYLFASEQDYNLCMKSESTLSEILSHAKGEKVKEKPLSELKEILELLKK